MILSRSPTRAKLFPRAPGIVLYPVAAALGLLTGYSSLMNPPLLKVLLLLPALVFALTVPPETIFAGWLFVAPLLQGASGGTDRGHILFKFLFFIPPLILVGQMALGGIRRSRLWAIDVLPALYLIYILVRVRFLPSEFTGTEASLRAIYAAVGIGIIGYYFTAFGRASDQLPITVARLLLWSGIVVAIFALVDAASGWNPWNNIIGGNGQLRRLSATLEGPVPVGTFLGVGVAFAAAILLWKGPGSLRRPATLLIGLAIPAEYFTYTRGPIVATATVGLFLALLANRARWPSVLACAVVGLVIFVSWNHLSSSAVYRERLGVTETVTTREAIQHESIRLFRQKPLFGWGYDTFDQAKLTLPNRDVRIQGETSHNTYLTILVELGVIGLTLLVLPFAVIAWRAVAAARRKLVEPWVVAGCVGSAASVAIGALTYDARFFSFTTALPLLTLGVARRLLANASDDAASALATNQ
jgi:O-antigen ligase